jgi:hypothetical protein
MARRTHIVLGMNIGTGVKQQPHIVHVAKLSSTHQRRRTALRAQMGRRPFAQVTTKQS